MEIKYTKHSFCDKLSLDYLRENIQIIHINKDNQNMVLNYMYNYSLNPKRFNLSNAFAITILNNQNNEIIGLFSFENNHISSKFNVSYSEYDERHFTEITYIIIDEKLIDISILKKCFSIIFPQLVCSQIVNEVIWCDYNKNLFSQIIDSFVKKTEFLYHYENVSYFFAEKIIDAIKFENEYKEKLYELMKNAGKK